MFWNESGEKKQKIQWAKQQVREALDQLNDQPYTDEQEKYVQVQKRHILKFL